MKKSLKSYNRTQNTKQIQKPMKTSVNFWDALFGEKVILEFPSPDGIAKKVKVTRKWIEKMEREGQIEQTSSIPAVKDSLLKKAEDLVSYSHFNALLMLKTLKDNFPFIEQVNYQQQPGKTLYQKEEILTVAGIFSAFFQLSLLNLSHDREVKLAEVIYEELENLIPQGVNLLENCQMLFSSEFDRLSKTKGNPMLMVSDSLGLWIVLNIFNHPPQTDDECKLIRMTGGMVTELYTNWWEE